MGIATFATGSLIASLPVCQFVSQPICQSANFPASQFASRLSVVHSDWSATRRKMWRQPDFTPGATACDKPPEGQQVSSIASLLVMQFASQPICQQVSQFVPSLSASQSVCQPNSQFASLPASPPASLPASQSISCQPVCQSVCQ